VSDGVCVVWAGFLEEPLEVVRRRPHLTLVVVHGGRDAPHTGATRLPVVAIVVVGRGHGPLMELLAPLLPPLMPSLALWMATSDNASSPLHGITSLLS
jgi:hypothetical protein